MVEPIELPDEPYRPSRLSALADAPAQLSRQERLVLYALTVGLRPERVLEIGTFRGGSTQIMCAALDDLGTGAIVCVDPVPQVHPDTWSGVAHRATLITGASPEAIGDAQAAAGGTFALAFIDGDHTGEGVRRDIDAVVPVLADDAHVLLHDAHHPPVREAIDAAVAAHAGAFTDGGLVSNGPSVDPGGVHWGGLRLLRFHRA